jgi:hypothetical protein
VRPLPPDSLAPPELGGSNAFRLCLRRCAAGASGAEQEQKQVRGNFLLLDSAPYHNRVPTGQAYEIVPAKLSLSLSLSQALLLETRGLARIE